MIVLVEPVPDATTPPPTKLSVVPAVDSADPSSCTVTPAVLIPPPPPEDAKVTVLVPGLFVIVMLLPATNVTVSSGVPASTFVEPETAIFLNALLLPVAIPTQLLTL